jgi:hypothetical protein
MGRMTSRRRRAPVVAAYALEWFAIVVRSLVFLTAIVGTLSLVVANFAAGIPLIDNPWSRVALAALTVASLVDLLLNRAVGRRRKAEARSGYTTSPDESLELAGRHPISGELLREAGTAPDVEGVAGLAKVPLPEGTIALPTPGITRFEPDTNWALWFTVVVTPLVAIPVLYLKLSVNPIDVVDQSWELASGILIGLAAVVAGIIATILVVRGALRSFWRAVARRDSPTAVVFSARRTATLDEALHFFGIRMSGATLVAVLAFDRLQLWDGSSLVLSVPWHEIVDVRPGRVSRGRWPVPRWSRAILVRLPCRGAEVDLALPPLAPYRSLYRANLLLDEFRSRTRVVPKHRGAP